MEIGVLLRCSQVPDFGLYSQPVSMVFNHDHIYVEYYPLILAQISKVKIQKLICTELSVNCGILFFVFALSIFPSAPNLHFVLFLFLQYGSLQLTAPLQCNNEVGLPLLRIISILYINATYSLKNQTFTTPVITAPPLRMEQRVREGSWSSCFSAVKTAPD